MAHDVLVNIVNTSSKQTTVTGCFTEDEKREIINIVFAAICERLQVEE